uniref:Outer membrane protein beta-barrel domain-containing protein n=1 Tax=Thermus islandicus TaxID=540988 RepID=A0A7C2C251_9DEIN
MKRLLLALTLATGLAWAQGTIGMRLGYGEGLGLTFGAAVETRLRQNLSGRLAADLAPAGPGVALEASLLFKPDLGLYEPSLKGLLPYLGGGVSGLVGPAPTLGVGLTLGLEGLLDPYTGLFAEGTYVYGFAAFPKVWRLALGANFR